jgi:putative membrane protein
MREICSRWLATLAALAASVGRACAQGAPDTERYGYGAHMMWWDGGWSMMIFGHLFMILTLAAAIVAIVFLVRWLGGPWPGSGPLLPPARTPLDILKERFARGEIDKNEFEERRRVLGE